MKATISHLFGSLKVHRTPNGKVIDELWPGYHVETTGEKKSTATVNWVKIHYLFDGKDKLGWVANAAPLKSGGPKYLTLEPEEVPPPPDLPRWESEGGRVVDTEPKILKVPAPPFKLHRNWTELCVTAIAGVLFLSFAIWVGVTIYGIAVAP